ncbi:hypothetical protein E1091_12155 [Micromonospora fluostatini]|uniref:Secreted protein n=1 Tax=Micromonospora fluostatini TaxID=1629071 RepID=A0ABY2DGH1_9ACTN|nr:hypothetical protein E1091_12155 [Micromonospora fluostatini]
MVVALIVLLVLCPCLGLAAWGVRQALDDGEPAAAPVPTASLPAPGAPASPDPDVPPTGEPTGEPSATTTRPTTDAGERFERGDCVVNDGTDRNADLRTVPCGPNTYEVLLRIPATTEGEQCRRAAPESTANYVHDNPVDFLDYVLCLRRR